MVDFEAAIKRPFQDFKKLGIGALMYMIPVVSFITMFFASGYGLECAKTAMKKKSKLPEWTDWGNLFLKGLSVFAIALIYSIPIGIIAAFMVVKAMQGVGSYNTMLSAQPEMIMSNMASLGLGFILFMVLLLLLSYIMPMVLMFFVDKWKFGDAFKLGEIFKKVFTGKYFVAWIVIMIYSFVIGFLVSIISVVTAVTFILPLILSAFLNMILLITSMTVFGEVYSEIK
jgi:hypothetical protein